MFFRYDEMPIDALLDERAERAKVIAEGLASAEIRFIERRNVELYLPNLDEVVAGDVSRLGLTVYLGGFDWVTYPTPAHLLARFPEFMPLPQQTYTLPDDEGL